MNPEDLELLERLIRIPSVTVDCAAVNRAVGTMRDWLSARGVFCAIETDPETGREALYAATTPGKAHDYLFVTHLDVVPGAPGQFEPRIDGDRLYGRGAGDTKGNAVAIARTLVNLVGTGVSAGAVFASDEESAPISGTPSPRLFLERGYVPRKFVMVGDTTGDSPRTLFTAEKGHVIFTLVAKGRGGHSSLPWKLDNPIPRLFEGYRRFLEAWPKSEAPSEPWQTFVSPTKLEGGASVNVIPDRATLSLSCRYVDPDDYGRVLKLLKETTGLEVIEQDPLRFRPPVVTDESDPCVQRLFGELKSVWPDFRLGRMNAATDACRYAHLGLPVVIFGAVCDGAHGANEWVSLSDLARWPEVLTRAVRNSEGLAHL